MMMIIIVAIIIILLFIIICLLLHQLLNKISINTVLMRTLDTLDYNNVLLGSDFKVILYLFSLQKFSNSQFTTFKCFSRISVQGLQINS